MAYLADGIPHHPCPHQVDENVLGFAEMMTIKLGDMMDQPRHVRIASQQNEKKRRIEQQQQHAEV